MASRTYDITLDCGCLISLDGGGGCIPCCYGYGCKGCNENHLCKKCIAQEKKCVEAWKKYKNSKEYIEHKKEIARRNQ